MTAPGDRPHRLRAEHLADPLGIGERSPRLSWWLPSGSVRQLAYELRGDNGWRTGRIDGDGNVLIPYTGPPLGAGDRVAWQVRVWTDDGESDWSLPHIFELGLLGPEDWDARWISPAEGEAAPPGHRPAWRLRGTCVIPGAARTARLYVTAHGIYEAFLNGQRVGDAELTPGFTAYGHRLQVQTYDVTDQVRVGENVLGALLSDGWFRGQVGLPRSHDQWGSSLALLAQLRIEHEDGSVTVTGTGEDWRSARSEIVAADLIAGQAVDCRLNEPGWTEPGFDTASWDRAHAVEAGFETLVCACAPPVRAVERIAPASVRTLPTGHVFDLGQNINGWVTLSDLGPAGTELTLTHGEAVDADGDVTTTHLEVDLPFLPERLPAGQVDRVISAGRAGEIFEPHHTTHGFRYVRVTGHPGPLTTDALTGVVVHSDLTRTGWFACSDERINRLHEAALWGLRGNICDIPTDCPTRERAGWTGDWQVFVPTAALLYDVAAFSVKWLRDLAAEQWESGVVANLAPSPPVESEHGPLAHLNGSAGWGDAAVIVPWEIHRFYGDRRVLEEAWPTMVAWMNFVQRTAATQRHPSRIAVRPDALAHERYLWDTGHHWGEWLVPGADLKGPEDFAAFLAADKADTATAYFHRSATLMSRIAIVLGRSDDARRYAALADDVRRAWRREFIGSDGRIVPDTQANLVRALAFELVPPDLRAASAARLVHLIRDAGTHLQTGFLATPYLLGVLADEGHLDVAYELLFRDTEPSWLTMIDRGATTLWERWNGVDADGVPYESLNHYSRGSVASFLYHHVAGIRLLDESPGYRRFEVRPQPGGSLTWAQARVDCPHGEIRSEWRRERGRLALSVTVPPGTEARITLPDGSTELRRAGAHTFETAER